MKIILFILFLVFYQITLSQKFRDRIEYLKSFQDEIYNSTENLKDTILIFDNLGPNSLIIQNYKTQGLGRINDVLLFSDYVSKILIGTAAGGLWMSNNSGNDWQYLKTNYESFGVSKLYQFSDTIWILTGDSELPSLTNSYSRGLIYSSDNLSTFNKIDFEINSKYLLTSMIDVDGVKFISTNKGIFTLNKTEIKNILDSNTLDGISRSLVYLKDCIYFTLTNNDSNYIYKYNLNNLQLDILYQSENSRIELRYTETNPNIIYFIEAKKNLDVFDFGIIENDKLLPLIQNSNIINNQLDYNLELTFSPYSKNIALIAGVPIKYTTDGFNSFTELPNIHVDVHSIKFHPLNNEIYICTDGGLFIISSDFKETKFKSFGLSISQIFSFDINMDNENFISIGTMDNGSLLYNGYNWQYIGSGDGMTQQFLNDSILFTSYQRGAVFKNNLNNGNSELLSDEIIKNENTPFYTNYLIKDSLLYYFNNNLIIKNLNNNSLNKVTVSDNIITRYKFDDENIYISNEKGKIFKYNTFDKNLEELTNINRYVSDILIEDDNIYISSSKNSQNSLFKYNLLNNKLDSLDISFPINSFCKINNELFLGTQNGLLFFNPDKNETFRIKNKNIDLGVITGITHNKNTNSIFVSTFSNGLFKFSDSLLSNNTPILNYSDTIYKCKNETIKLNVTNSEEQKSYIWNNNVVGVSNEISAEGIYYVSLIDNNFKLPSKPIYIKNYKNDEIKISLPEGNFVCPNDKIQIVLNTNNKNITWSNGLSSKTIEVSKGKYWASIIDSNGCKIISDTIEVIEYSSPQKPIISKEYNFLISENNVDWYLNGELILENSTKLEILDYGKYYCISKNEYCKSISDTVEIYPENTFKLYPNPTSDIVYIELFFNNIDNLDIQISDLQGKIVLTKNIIINNKPSFETLDISNLSRNTYLFNVIYKNSILSQKVIKE